jgi:sugar lactone lactonase YvrE
LVKIEYAFNLTISVFNTQNVKHFLYAIQHAWLQILCAHRYQKQRQQQVKSEMSKIVRHLSLLVLAPLPDGICAQAVWSRNGVTVAGGNGNGNKLNQLSRPTGLFIDEDDGSIYVADQDNKRVIKWDSPDVSSSNNGVVVASGHGTDDDILYAPVDLVVDKNGTMFICDYGYSRVIRWSRGASNGEIFISNISCGGLAIHGDQFLYVTDFREHRVTRWNIRTTGIGEIVAGGHGDGSAFNQLKGPYYSFVDKDRSVYVADHQNNRIMKWIESAQVGILIAGANESGSEMNQLSLPTSVVVDQIGSFYVTDTLNNRVMRYLKGSKEGMVILGGDELGDGPDQFTEPFDISIDRNGNLYVVDMGNERIQMFKIDKSACGKFHS